jgi:hypothetical protein
MSLLPNYQVSQPAPIHIELSNGSANLSKEDIELVNKVTPRLRYQPENIHLDVRPRSRGLGGDSRRATILSNRRPISGTSFVTVYEGAGGDVDPIQPPGTTEGGKAGWLVIAGCSIMA